jgi:hypothetical protein
MLAKSKGVEIKAGLLFTARKAASPEFCGIHHCGGSRRPIRHIIVLDERNEALSQYVGSPQRLGWHCFRLFKALKRTYSNQQSPGPIMLPPMASTNPALQRGMYPVITRTMGLTR